MLNVCAGVCVDIGRANPAGQFCMCMGLFGLVLAGHAWRALA